MDLTVERVAPTADRLLLDTRGLEIEAVGLRDEAGAVTPLEHRLGLRAVMSAARDPRPSGAGEHRFVMPQPIPAYLVALAVGDLEFRELGPRTGVYAEPTVLAAAAHEFADLEAMLVAAERLFGPYRWDRYDLLIMPPSFPIGGMENPRLSFISPTVIAGDRSLVSMITHEMAHSWSGNLVTNAGWGDFWLNEGVYGQRLAAMELVLGRQYLDEEIAGLMAAGKPSDTALALDLRGREPDEALSNIAYEKGSLFLQFVEWRVGRAAMDRFLAGYFRDFGFRTVTTAEFEAYLRAQLLARHPDAVGERELRQWLYGTGLPSGVPPVREAALVAVERQRDEWLAGWIETDDLAVESWSPQQWMRFLDTLPDDLTDQRLADLEARGALAESGNYEVLPAGCCWRFAATTDGPMPASRLFWSARVGTRWSSDCTRNSRARPSAVLSAAGSTLRRDRATTRRHAKWWMHCCQAATWPETERDAPTFFAIAPRGPWSSSPRPRGSRRAGSSR